MSALEIMLEKAYDEGVKKGKKDAESELKHTKRALWLARAERAFIKASKLRYIWLVSVSVKKSKDMGFVKKVRRDYDVWCRIDRKCRTYADKFKE